MGYMAANSTEFIILLGVLVVFLSAMSRFNNPQTIVTTTSSWIDLLRHSFSWKPGQQNLLLRPPRANTTIFRYRLYQFLYALLAILVYLLVLFQPGILDQIQSIILWFANEELTVEDMPVLAKAGPLVIAAFVVLILPNVPPFHWADLKIRSMLYDRALIPAQQLREMYRLKNAPYMPDEKLIDQVRSIAVTDGFDARDIVYNSEKPTTHSLWGKSALLIKQIKIWEADDHYKTAFSTLKEPDSEKRTVDVVKEMQKNLISDARVFFNELRLSKGEKSEELINRETEFRSNCRTLLEKMYSLLAGVSLHSHYSDHDRIVQFGKFGFHLEPDTNGPIPDSNDLLILTIILCIFLVLPLSYKLGLVKAVMIGAIMFSAVLTPICLAHVCPRMFNRSCKRYAPNVLYPLVSGAVAAFIGYMIFYIGGQFLEPSGYCNFTGIDRYINCTYPWSFLHGGIALLLAVRLGTGEYPDVGSIKGIQSYRQWGDIKDAIICATGMLIITVAIVVPLLEQLGRNFEGVDYLGVLLRISIVSFVLGFIVPTWYRAHHKQLKVNRRQDIKDRRRFDKKIDSRRHGLNPE